MPYDEAYEEGFEDMPRRVPDIAKVGRLIGYRPAGRSTRSSKTSSPIAGAMIPH